MTELMWPPSRLAGLTVTQLACLCQERAPGQAGGRLATWQEMAAELERQAEAERRWAAPGSWGG